MDTLNIFDKEKYYTVFLETVFYNDKWYMHRFHDTCSSVESVIKSCEVCFSQYEHYRVYREAVKIYTMDNFHQLVDVATYDEFIKNKEKSNENES